MPVPIYLPRKAEAGGIEEGWWCLPALFAFKLQITRKPGSEKSLAVAVLPD